jgi:uncharacterized cupredoxin-like copper-binding protein
MQLPTLLRRASVPTVAGLIILLASCSSGRAATPSPTTSGGGGSVVHVSAMDDMFHGPTTISPGMTTIQIDNAGPSVHHVQLLRLHDGVTPEQATAAAQSPDLGALLALVDPVGGPGAVPAGGTQAVTLDLAAGTYLEVCFIPGDDGIPHVAKGMVSTLTVTGTPTKTPPPIAAHTATLHDFRFDLPDPFAGSGTLAVTNDGPQPHELAIVKLEDGKTAADIGAFFANPDASGPPPYTDAGGMAALAPGQTGYLDLHLQPGNYAAICFVPDSATGKPHAMLGMVSAFTVS